jgi:hypothetical protein
MPADAEATRAKTCHAWRDQGNLNMITFKERSNLFCLVKSSTSLSLVPTIDFLSSWFFQFRLSLLSILVSFIG